MIFYFTGTGNSLYVAQNIAENQYDELISIAECMRNKRFDFQLNEREKIGFSFPVYFWGMPTVVEEFLHKLNFTQYDNHYAYVVLNCGGNIGNSDNMFKKIMREKGVEIKTVFSVFMPDNYILLMDLLTPEDKIQPLLAQTDKRLIAINEAIANQEPGNLKLHKGKMAWLQSTIMHTYYKNDRSTKPFHATDDCISCGLCAEICPCEAISLSEGKPVWRGKCTQCLGCLHRCPVKAVEYGNKTVGKGRYINPNCKW